MISAIKKLVFDALPKSLQHAYVVNKKGSKVVAVNVGEKNKFQMHMMHNSELWDNRLNSHYGHEPQITKFYEEHLKSDDVAFDIGAHMGYFPSLISAINPTVRFYGVEANWYMYGFLKRNKALNDKNNTWRIFNCFVSDSDFTKDGDRFITMNTFINQEQVVPTIFQMDVDGEEYRIINGATKLLGNGVTEFIIETHPKDLGERGVTVHQFLDLFSPAHYDFVYLPDLRNFDSQWVNSLDKVDLTQEFYLYAAPKGKLRIKV